MTGKIFHVAGCSSFHHRGNHPPNRVSSSTYWLGRKRPCTLYTRSLTRNTHFFTNPSHRRLSTSFRLTPQTQIIVTISSWHIGSFLVFHYCFVFFVPCARLNWLTVSEHMYCTEMRTMEKHWHFVAHLLSECEDVEEEHEFAAEFQASAVIFRQHVVPPLIDVASSCYVITWISTAWHTQPAHSPFYIF